MIGLALVAPGAARAETPTCAGCLLGVYDDRAMTRTSGTCGPFQTKSIYLGIRLGSEVSDYQSMEFRAGYPDGFTLLDWTSFVPNARVQPTSDGGVRVEWADCVRGTRALFQVRFISFASVSDARVQVHDAVLETCAASGAGTWRIPGGCYVLNPSGHGDPCATSVAASTWGAVRQLFR